MKVTTAITLMLPSTTCFPVLEGGVRTELLFIKLGWNIYGRIFLRRANDTVMDGNLALLTTLLTPNVWVFTSSNSLQTPAGCATMYFNSVTNDTESVQIPQDKSSAPQDGPPSPIQMPIVSDRLPGYHTSDYRLGVPMAPSPQVWSLPIMAHRTQGNTWHSWTKNVTCHSSKQRILHSSCHQPLWAIPREDSGWREKQDTGPRQLRCRSME